MAALQKVLVAIVVFCFACASSDDFNRDFDDVNSCQDICDKKYTSLPDGKVEQSECCKRGCRLFSILSFVHDHSDSNATITDCAANCNEAYGNQREKDRACQLGCDIQLQASTQAAAQVEGKHRQMEDDMRDTVHMLYPLLYMHSVYSNMLDKVHHHMEVSWSIFTQANSGELVVLRSEPRIIDFVSSDEEDIPDGVPWLDDKTSSYVETNIVGQDNSATPLLNFRASQMGAAHSPDDGLRLDTDDRAGRSDWLTCVAKKTGIARIVLCILILATAVVMIWFCLSAATTAPEQHLSISGDLEYLRAMGEKDGFKLLHPQDRVEARPLPIKIRVEQI